MVGVGHTSAVFMNGEKLCIVKGSSVVFDVSTNHRFWILSAVSARAVWIWRGESNGMIGETFVNHKLVSVFRMEWDCISPVGRWRSNWYHVEVHVEGWFLETWACLFTTHDQTNVLVYVNEREQTPDMIDAVRRSDLALSNQAFTVLWSSDSSQALLFNWNNGLHWIRALEGCSRFLVNLHPEIRSFTLLIFIHRMYLYYLYYLYYIYYMYIRIEMRRVSRKCGEYSCFMNHDSWPMTHDMGSGDSPMVNVVHWTMMRVMEGGDTSTHWDKYPPHVCPADCRTGSAGRRYGIVWE
jgi:hypothetical protein